MCTARLELEPGSDHEVAPRLAARRWPGPRCPDPRSIGMSGFIACWYSLVPHLATMAALTSRVLGPRRAPKWIGVALEDDQRLCDGCVAAKSARPERADGEGTASRLPTSSSTAVMLSAHCSRWAAHGVTGSDALVPGWSKKISRPSDVIASTPPEGTALRRTSQGEPLGTNTMSRGPSGDARYATRNSPLAHSVSGTGGSVPDSAISQISGRSCSLARLPTQATLLPRNDRGALDRRRCWVLPRPYNHVTPHP
jgi:hypothetical protein